MIGVIVGHQDLVDALHASGQQLLAEVRSAIDQQGLAAAF